MTRIFRLGQSQSQPDCSQDVQASSRFRLRICRQGYACRVLQIFAILAVSLTGQSNLFAQESNRPKSANTKGVEAGDDTTIRFATFNVSFNRKNEGQLEKELAKGRSLNPARVAEIIQRVRPDVLLVNEFDYDANGKGIDSFARNFLAVSQNEQSSYCVSACLFRGGQYGCRFETRLKQ